MTSPSAAALKNILGARRADNSQAIPHACYSRLLRVQKRYDEATKIERDPSVQAIVMKADALIGATADHSALAQSATADFLSALAPISAGARLIAAGLDAPLEAQASINFPRAADPAASVNWVAEGAPIPVDEFSFEADALGPQKKMGVIVNVTRELMKRSAGFVTFETMLRERAAASIDAALFSADSGTDTRHAGLRAGVTPLASSNMADDDVERLLSAVAEKGGTNFTIIGNARDILTLQVRLPRLADDVALWSTRALSKGTVIGLDRAAFASSVGEIDIEAGESAVMHMSDTPLEIVSGTGPTTADPVRSAWQTATISLRLLIDIAFVQRGERVAVMDGAAWSTL